MALSSRPNMGRGASVVKFVKFVNSDGAKTCRHLTPRRETFGRYLREHGPVTEWIAPMATNALNKVRDAVRKKHPATNSRTQMYYGVTKCAPTRRSLREQLLFLFDNKNLNFVIAYGNDFPNGFADERARYG
jgi:hypothetical protein